MASYANSIVASLCCSYFEDDGTQWQLQVRPTFLDISCPKRHVAITMAVSPDKGETAITYEEETEYKCGADVTESYFVSDHCKLILGLRRYVVFDTDENGAYEMDEDGDPVEDAYVEVVGAGILTKHFMIQKVARILMAIAKNAPVEELKELGARRISFLS
jgi:hypothetical protein